VRTWVYTQGGGGKHSKKFYMGLIAQPIGPNYRPFLYNYDNIFDRKGSPSYDSIESGTPFTYV